jgi:hypothetical protein
MTPHVCLYANTISSPQAGGQFWVFLNWALGLQALGCEVTWMENAGELRPEDRPAASALLAERLHAHAASVGVALVGNGDGGLDRAAECDLLLNLSYDCRPWVVGRFARRALVDIDPGLTQEWMRAGELDIARHDVYFTTGETVGRPGSRIPDVGLRWEYTPPAVHLAAWPRRTAGAEAAYTTVTHWWDQWQIIDGEDIDNAKRQSFLGYAGLPELVAHRLELALALAPDDIGDRIMLQRHGWRVRAAAEVSSTPGGYRDYIQASRGEFSVAKPSCILQQNAWVSDRTLCYLASGKPAIVQHTGESRILPDGDGLFRFRNLAEAAAALRGAEACYEHHCAAARALAEEHFDAVRVAGAVLERAL